LQVFSDELAEQIMTHLPDPDHGSSDSKEGVDTPGLYMSDEKDGKPVLSNYVFKPQAKKSGSGSSRILTSSTSSGPSPRRRLTPLQRLGQTALARSRSVNALPQTKAFVPPNLVERSATTFTHGSEDLIIPNTDDEDDGDDTSKPQEPINLEKFLYAR
jgi:exonuclease-1